METAVGLEYGRHVNPERPEYKAKRRSIYCTFVTEATDKSLSREAKSSEIVMKCPACYLTKRLVEIWFWSLY